MYKRFYLPILLLVSILIAAGCNNSNGNEENSGESNETSAEENNAEKTDKEENGASGHHTDLLTVEGTPFDESLFEVVDFESDPSPNDYYYQYASSGALAMGGENHSIFFDYRTGERLSLETDVERLKGRAESSIVNTDSYTWPFLFGNYYYLQGNDVGTNKIIQVDLSTGEIEDLADADGPSDMVKKDDILYIISADKLSALDTNTKETIWETTGEVELSTGYAELHATDHALIYEDQYGLTAFDIKDGTKLFEEEGVFRDVAVDGSTFYALADEADAFSDSLYKVVEFDDQEGKKETIIEAPEVEEPYEIGEIKLDLVDDLLYITVENGILTYDINSHEQLWSVSVGDLKDRSETETGDDYNYWFSAGITGNHVYAFTEKSNVANDRDNFLTVIDSKTGEVKNQYSFGKAIGAGPIIDEENGNVMVYLQYFNDEGAQGFILPIE